VTEIVNDAYLTLKRFGLVRSQSEFSVRWLRRSASYIRTMKALNREVAVEPLTVLGMRVTRLREHLAHTTTSPNALPVIRRARAEIGELESRLWSAVRHRCERAE
jgi:hypothetical protein